MIKPLMLAGGIVIQSELIYSLLITIALIIAFYVIGNKVKQADPLARPHGIVLAVETGIDMLKGYIGSMMDEKFAKNYYPYFAMIFIYLLVANVSGLIGFEAPTSNFSITLAITIVTFCLIQYNAIKKQGIGSYIKGQLLPPTNLLGTISPLISLSMRIFGNILSGTILMSLVYSFTGWLSGVVGSHFNLFGPVIAPILHCYFDLFAGFVQTLVFVTLSCILISIEAEDSDAD